MPLPPIRLHNELFNQAQSDGLPSPTSSRDYRLTNVDALKPRLLDLLSPAQRVDDNVLFQLTPDEQASLLDMIKAHRLGPLLRYSLGRFHPNVIVPESIDFVLKQAARTATFRSLHAQQNLIKAHRVLSASGIPYIALKGAYLAFHAYPQPGLRPLRDLDILVPRDRVLEAYDTLQHHGFQSVKKYHGNLEVLSATRHDLPPLTDSSSRFQIELHNSLTHNESNNLSISDDLGFWDRSVRRRIGSESVFFESPTDLLLHLIHHATYHHQFDNGPLLLSDIAFLLDGHTIEWTDFWDRAKKDSIVPGCILVLKLVQRYWPQAGTTWPKYAIEYPNAEILDDAALSLLRDYENHGEVILKKSFAYGDANHRAKLLLSRVFPSRLTISAVYPVQPDHPSVYLFYIVNFWRLVTSRLPKIWQANRIDHNQEIARIRRVESWLGIN